MTDYPPYSGDRPHCAKCGHKGAATEYRAYGTCVHPDMIHGYERNERLHRECARCRYQWDEALARTGQDPGNAAAPRPLTGGPDQPPDHPAPTGSYSCFSYIASATPRPKKVGAHSPTKIPHRSARAWSAPSAFRDAVQLAIVSPMLTIAAA